MFRKLGKNNISAVGLGCMGMSEFYGATDDKVSLQTLKQAYDIGYRNFDTADMYGQGHNEELVGKFINESGIERSNLFISTKGGIVRSKTDKYSISVDSSADYIKSACEASLKRLNTDYIDLYYVHRLNPETDISETMGALQELVREGKIKNIGLCEVSSEQIKAAHNIHPIAAVQSELSLWSREVEENVLPTCSALDIALVAFSPLGRGFLGGNIDKNFMNSVSEDLDFRKRLPRFNDENIEKNMLLVKKLEGLAQEISTPVSQLALHWVLSRASNVHIIPGSKTSKYLQSNFDAQNLDIPSSVLSTLDEIFSPDEVFGSRYPEKILSKSA
ncbi:aldo/keto reductase [Catenovulum sp. SM1970]|uniref:aldo/keto reductase n=1 Tax=Marinifaba aquimaris TaxID=2741323 RepID=UPI00157318DB|nr:aldo/keto reductase [Marinifaba aquimaris]NTS75305.1 aldo/keto reductase [Marinifaba aquimaris]